MKILFINIQLRPDSVRRQLPVGLAYIMTTTKKARYDFDLYDMDINNYNLEDLRLYLKDNHYPIYAMGCIVTGYKKVKEIAQVIREENPFAHIVVGNSVASSIPKIFLNNTEVNYAVIGEGEGTWLDLLKHIGTPSNLHSIRGLALCNSRKVVPCGWENPFERKLISDLDSIGFPDWSIFDLDKYNKFRLVNVNDFSGEDIVSFPLSSARGCPYNCTFCYHVFKGGKYRRYSVDSVVNEIRRLYYVYGCNYISFWDDLTFPNIVSAKKFIEALSELPFEIRWEANTIPGVFSEDDLLVLKDMKAVGCNNLGFSLESASPIILKSMNKKFKLEEFIEQAKVVKKSGIVPVTSVLFGYPEETIETIKETIGVCREVGIFPSAGFLLPLPGTPIYDWAVKSGKISDETEYLERIGDRQDLHINMTSMYVEEFYGTVKQELEQLAKDQGIKLKGGVFKTVKRLKPKC